MREDNATTVLGQGGNLPQGEDKVRAVRGMFDTIAPRYDLLNRVIALGLDRGWRRRTVRALGGQPGRGAPILDVACGTGDLCRELRQAGYHPVGIDLSGGMLRHARAGGVPLVQGDALRTPFPSAVFGGAVSGFGLRNLVDLDTFFAELARLVAPGGRVALLDVATPTNPLLRAGNRVWFEHAVPRIGGLLSDPAAYRYLPRSVAYLPPPPAVLDRLRDAGFEEPGHRGLAGGVVQLFTATRRRAG